MQIKKVLITSDDGFDSKGIRLLVDGLKDKFDLAIAGTLEQMSGVGGKISMSGGKWGKGEVKGVKALWVDGTPVDAIDVAHAYFRKKFDLVISGINWGANVGGSFITSGTIAAAWRSLVLNFAGYAMAISWDSNPDEWFTRYDVNSQISKELVEYPGRAALEVIKTALREEFWHVRFLNVNLPRRQTRVIRFCEPLADFTKYYKYPINLDKKAGRFSYPSSYSNKMETNLRFDSASLTAGYITITPCKTTVVDRTIYDRFKGKKIKLEN